MGVLPEDKYNQTSYTHKNKISGGRKEEADYSSVPPLNEGLAVTKIDMGNISHLDARDAASEGGRASRQYRGKQKRVVKNTGEEIEADKVSTELIRGKTELLNANNEFLIAAGQKNTLPPIERGNIELKEMQNETSMLGEQVKQEELKKKIEEIKNPPLRTPDVVVVEVNKQESKKEKYEKVMEGVEQEMEFKEALKQKQKILQIRNLTEMSRVITQWENEMREKYPDRADEIIDRFNRVMEEEG